MNNLDQLQFKATNCELWTMIHTKWKSIQIAFISSMRHGCNFIILVIKFQECSAKRFEVEKVKFHKMSNHFCFSVNFAFLLPFSYEKKLCYFQLFLSNCHQILFFCFFTPKTYSKIASNVIKDGKYSNWKCRGKMEEIVKCSSWAQNCTMHIARSKYQKRDKIQRRIKLQSKWKRE